MFRFIAICAFATLAAAAPGFVQQHVVAAPLATSHQTITQYHSKAVLTPVVKHVAPVVPVVKTIAPVVPVVKTIAPVVPVVKTIAPVVPVVKTIAPVVPVVKTIAPVVPVVKTVTPVVHHHTYVAPAPVVKHIAPVAVSHQSHVQIHQKAIVTPVLKTVAIAAPVVPVVKTIAAAPLAHVYHHHH
ncbi:actin cytoskeleton-regulatory complex protein PAN1 [Scaptodrosophila lebanonensis]|uniref:Actin cytoskeleton-regulatory complex protein PAN1 n=1 Tax=Drosophila lebanonensis TaxID=7225 RepID=A0A6J2UE64_DROLE|nr:actin cytoskeleton-regulatory complex protein PAN1 [Scaptodrosophila lebanonensis]